MAWQHVVGPGFYRDHRNRRQNVYVTIKWDAGRLSITGVEGPRSNGNAEGSCGQIHKSIAALEPAIGWTETALFRLAQLWERWHLNDMRAGCEHQRALGWRSYDEHPAEPCPVCGYKYGSAWLREDVPQDVLDWLHALPTVDGHPWGDSNWDRAEPDVQADSDAMLHTEMWGS